MCFASLGAAALHTSSCSSGRIQEKQKRARDIRVQSHSQTLDEGHGMIGHDCKRNDYQYCDYYYVSYCYCYNYYYYDYFDFYCCYYY